MRRREAQLEREGAVDVEGSRGGVAEVDDEEVGRGQLATDVADCGGLADAGLRGEYAKAWVFEQVLEAVLEPIEADGLAEEGVAGRGAWQRVVGEPEACWPADEVRQTPKRQLGLRG